MSTVVVNVETPTVVVVNTPTRASVVNQTQNTTVANSPTMATPVCECDGSPVVEVNVPGPQGRPGDTDAAVISAVVGEAISALRVVRFVNNELFRASASNTAHAQSVIGITVTATSNAGETASVRTDGEMSDASWSWTPGAVFCGDNGALTQTPPLAGFVLEVARVRSPTRIVVDIQNPFIRS